MERRDRNPGDPSGIKPTLRGVMVEIAPGELLDKITILQIKMQRIKDPAKLANVQRELERLNENYNAAIPRSDKLDALVGGLREANERLWVIEDELRICEAAGDFGPKFIELARSVYRENDLRSAFKRQINELLGSGLIEEKDYGRRQ
jgi:hypothetical protein